MAYPKTKGTIKGDKALQPHAGIPLKNQVTPEQLSKMIKDTGGNLSRIADAVGSTRGCVRRYVDSLPELQKDLEDSRERLLDNLEDAVWEDAIAYKDPAMRCFLLKTRGKHRGYGEDGANIAKDIATAAFDFILNKSKNPAETRGSVLGLGDPSEIAVEANAT